MQRSLVAGLLGAVLALGSPAALPASAPAPEPVLADDVEDFTVVGQRPSVERKLMLDFVLDIGDPVSSNRGFARWRDRLCVGVHNLTDTAAAQYLADDISGIALDLGLEPGEPGCRPNLNVVFTQDGRGMATRLVDTQPGIFRPFGVASGTTQGLPALEQFKNSDAAVRWWHITMLVDEMGFIAIDIPGGAAVDPTNGLSTPPQIRGTNSRLKSAVRDELWGSLVIVDASKLGNVKWSQLGAYLAMISLAQISPDNTPASHESILNLFRGDRTVPGLTEMDRAYLRALYAIDTHMMPRSQRGMLARRMLSERNAIRE